MKPQHLIMTGAGVLLILFLLSRAFKVEANAGFYAPRMQESPQDGSDRAVSYNPDGHPGHVCDSHAGYVYTPHRYPRQAGGEITAIIHQGFSPMRVPTADWAQWIVNPPSESQWA